MRRITIILAVATLSGCSIIKTDKAKVGDFLAARLYHEDRYERLCVAQVGPPKCAEMRARLNEWKYLNGIANDVQKLGDMPSEEKKEIRRVWRQVEALP